MENSDKDLNAKILTITNSDFGNNVDFYFLYLLILFLKLYLFCIC